MAMKVEDQRATPQFRVQFHTTVSGSTQPDGTGIMHDLSRGVSNGRSVLHFAGPFLRVTRLCARRGVAANDY